MIDRAPPGPFFNVSFSFNGNRHGSCINAMLDLLPFAKIKEWSSAG